MTFAAQLASASAVVERPVRCPAWMAAYVGADDRYPGGSTRAEVPPDLQVPWSSTGVDHVRERLLSGEPLGDPVEPWKNVQLGAEQVFPETKHGFGCGWIRNPAAYFWWQVSEHGDHNLGWIPPHRTHFHRDSLWRQGR